MKKLFTLFLFIFIGQYTLSGQCNPAAGLTCEEAGLLCSLDELDGFSCTTLSTSNPTGPNPLCNGSGVPNNTQWWAFKSNGKNMTITFDVDMSSCTMNKGISAGILHECGGVAAACNADCNTNSFSLTYSSYACQTNYLWVDGCEGDICDFDIQVTNGGPKYLPNPLIIKRFQHSRRPCELSVFCVEIEGICDIEHFQWSVDGVNLPSRGDQFCVTLSNPKPGEYKEVCVDLTVGDGGVICEQSSNCKIFDFEPSEYINEGDIYVCLEENQESKFEWRDSIIYSSCISPPCNKLVQDPDGCYREYTASIFMNEQRGIGSSSVFICGKENLPYETEDGQSFIEEACGEEIKWINMDYYNCDSTYILYLDIFDPIVSLTQSCPECYDSTVLSANIEYEPECINQTLWLGFWLDESLDTIAFGDSLITNIVGNYTFHLFVQNTNSFTGISNTCYMHDTSWHINIEHDSLSISGDSLICQKDTSEFYLPDAYSNGCEILWMIEDLDGQIITLEPEKKSKIEVYWPTDNTTDGKICAEIIDACDSVRKVCRTLEGCVTTQNINTNTTPWKVFPNPARDVIYIEGDLNELDIQMHDLHGNTISIQPKQDISGAISINVERLSSGVYFILLSEGEKSGVFKLLIL